MVDELLSNVLQVKIEIYFQKIHENHGNILFEFSHE